MARCSGRPSFAGDNSDFLSGEAGVFDGFAEEEDFVASQAWREGALVHDDEVVPSCTCPCEVGQFALNVFAQYALALRDVLRHGVRLRRFGIPLQRRIHSCVPWLRTALWSSAICRSRAACVRPPAPGSAVEARWARRTRRTTAVAWSLIAGTAKKLGVHRRMVREAIHSALPAPRKKTERPRWKIGAAVEFVDAILEADRKAPRTQRHTAHRIWVRI